MEPRGILRNKASPTTEQAEEFDRQAVIRNTRLNALMASDTRGGLLRAKIAEAKSDGRDPPEHLQWDEINLYKTEQEKAATMKIDEPKTPYLGGFDPNGEYYQDDDTAEPIPEFTLGESEFEPAPAPEQEDEEEQEEEKQELTAEEKHKRFEEMRKAHYHNAANPLKHKIQVPDEDLGSLKDATPLEN